MLVKGGTGALTVCLGDKGRLAALISLGPRSERHAQGTDPRFYIHYPLAGTVRYPTFETDR